MSVITVAVCTRNRRESLGLALKSLEKQTLARAAYEILVVDNGSTDGTSELVRQDFPQVRIVLEPSPGLSLARNRALHECSSPLLAFIDDDAEADERWLEALVAAFDSTGSAVIGGRIEPVWESPPQPWLSSMVWTKLTILQEMEPGYVADGRRVAGCNIAFRRDELLAVGGFESKLGRKGNLPLSGEETLAMRRIMARGGSAYYEPAAVVLHHIQPTRMRPWWLLRHHYWHGFSEALVMDHLGRGPEVLEKASAAFDRLKRRIAGGRDERASARSPVAPVAAVYGATCIAAYAAGYGLGVAGNLVRRI